MYPWRSTDQHRYQALVCHRRTSQTTRSWQGETVPQLVNDVTNIRSCHPWFAVSHLLHSPQTCAPGNGSAYTLSRPCLLSPYRQGYKEPLGLLQISLMRRSPVLSTAARAEALEPAAQDAERFVFTLRVGGPQAQPRSPGRQARRAVKGRLIRSNWSFRAGHMKSWMGAVSSALTDEEYAR